MLSAAPTSEALSVILLDNAFEFTVLVTWTPPKLDNAAIAVVAFVPPLAIGNFPLVISLAACL